MRKKAFNHIPPGLVAVQLHDRALARSAAATVMANKKKQRKRKRKPPTQRGMDGWRGGLLMRDARQVHGSGTRIFQP